MLSDSLLSLSSSLSHRHVQVVVAGDFNNEPGKEAWNLLQGRGASWGGFRKLLNPHVPTMSKTSRHLDEILLVASHLLGEAALLFTNGRISLPVLLFTNGRISLLTRGEGKDHVRTRSVLPLPCF